MLRVALLFIAAVSLGLTAMAEEVINRFDVAIAVEQDGDIVVTETINVTVEGNQIRRGIFRDLPRYFTQDGDRLRYDYDVLSVQRDGQSEPYETTTDGNAWRIRIGDPDRQLSREPHVYAIRYRVKNQIRYFDEFDELYWNVTGSYWAFPILTATARVTFPDGAQMVEQNGYTGGQGARGSAYRFRREGDAFAFETTEPLGREEGFTISLAIEKGVIDPPSAADKSALWWQRYGAVVILLVSLGGVFYFLYRSWRLVGVDPPKGPVFARYEAPEGYSPAAAHHIYHRGFHDHDALIATLVNLGIKGRVEIYAKDKKKIALTPKSEGTAPLASEEALLERKLLSGGPVMLGGKYNSAFTKAYMSFRKRVSRRFGSDYFKWNVGYTIFAVALSGAAIVWAILQATGWTPLLTGLVLAIVVMNGVFMYLMPAPTPKGQDVRTEIEGFKLYMEKAEKLQLNVADVGSGQPPPMTTERYEKFLPYAIALGVEKPWTKYFEKVLPEEAASYHPAWGHMGRYGSYSSFNRAMVASMSSAVTSAMPQSSSSSGSGGGGFSGGGGGGGGGGGW
ncbi:DUF2207 domain-containing protein [Henriciella aquimarina]|uniref:DUF2207 domain-containing protein n=1 Tax=Henriciella aquimarina TaxID=545261 RepID=UPI000A0614D7|nr:DUF2207 domain-containing protein [Henriciella aquimarina]